MLPVLGAVFLGTALVLDVARASQGVLTPETFMLAGLLCLALSALPPRRP